MSLVETIQDPLALDPAQALDAAEMRARLADAIAGLPEKEKVVVALYYYEDLTLREIGEVLRVTESRVSQIRTKAMLRLKARLEASEHVRLSNRQNADPTCGAALPERRRDRIAADGPHGGGGGR